MKRVLAEPVELSVLALECICLSKQRTYRSEVPDSCRRSISDDQVSFKSHSLLLVDLHYGHMQRSQMLFQETAASQCVSIVSDRPDLSFRFVLGRRVLRASATVSEEFVVLTRFSSSPVNRRRDLLSFGVIGLLSMGRGSYYLASSTLNQWLPIDEDGKKLSGKLDVSDDKKREIVWGLPSSNKYWKGAWFFVCGDWGRSLPTDREKSLSEAYVPCLFTQPCIFATSLLCLCFYSVYREDYPFTFKENPVAADIDACDLEEEPLLRPSSAKGKGPVIEKEEETPKSVGGDSAEVHVDVAGASRGVVGLLEEVGMPWVRSRVSGTRGVFALSEIAGSPEAMFARDCRTYQSEVPDSHRRSTSDDQVSFKSHSLFLVDLHYGHMQRPQMSFQEGLARVGNRFRGVRGAHEVLAVSGKSSSRPPFLWSHRIALNGTRTHIFSPGAMPAVGDDVAIYGEILHTTTTYSN
ncbi:hypothetical protein ACOSP7_018259 [Xanthoceras sorbifolium]